MTSPKAARSTVVVRRLFVSVSHQKFDSCFYEHDNTGGVQVFTLSYAGTNPKFFSSRV